MFVHESLEITPVERCSPVMLTTVVMKSSALDQIDDIQRFRANADRCRSLAAGASDPEVAKALNQLATDFDAAVLLLEDDARSKPSCAG